MEVSTPLQNTIPLIYCQAFCKLPKTLFRQFPIYIYIFFFWLPSPSPKNCWAPIILTFFIFDPSYLLKVTIFLVKICQFKFLVMADKHFGLYFFVFKISDFSLFFMQQLRSIPPPAQKSHPLFSSNLPLKIEILPGPIFWKFGRRLNPPSESGSIICK